MNAKSQLELLPSVDQLLSTEQAAALANAYSRAVVKETLRQILAAARERILAGKQDAAKTREDFAAAAINEAEELLKEEFAPSLKSVINATGIILHTGLGRAPLSAAAKENVIRVMNGYSGLEIDVRTGKRGDRNEHVSGLLRKLTGAEDAVVVNNNAAAVFLALNTMCFGKEAVISRGQLIEIGGSFRIPEVMEKSGAIMREVGTTNKTRLSDYEKAIGHNTGAIVVAHTSNYRVMGFTAEVPLYDIAELAHLHGLSLLHDLGGGVLIDLRKFGLPYEPLVQDSLTAGADVVTFSGDKILGGPQCGIMVGKKAWIGKIRSNPIMRAMRCDKLIFAALEATLKLYFQEKTLLQNNRTLRLLTEPIETIEARAKTVLERIGAKVKEKIEISIASSVAQTGSGALPLEQIPSKALVLKPADEDAEKLAAKLRRNEPPIIGYIQNDQVYLDLRTVAEAELAELAEGINGQVL
jgi:L-seryl-tRNA(Ser) seleniumtransferase